jgi:type I restriction enzyme S subunit
VKGVALLGDVCQITMGQAPSGDSYNDQGEGLPLVAGAGDFAGSTPSVKKFTTAPGKVSQEGDIILGIRASIGERVWSDRPYCLGRGVAGLRPSEKLDRNYLWHWLGHSADRLKAKGRGATFLQVNRADVNEMEIPLPPLDEQRRIAAILDQADGLRAARQQSLLQLEALGGSLFTEMFGSLECQTAQLSEVVRPGTIVTYGIVQAGAEYDGGVPYIRTGDIVDGAIRTTGLRHTAPAIAAKFERSRIGVGDVVMSIRATVGTTALVPPELDGANLTQGTAKISPSDVATGPYLLHYLRSPGAQRWIQAQVKGATFREITLGALRQLPVPLVQLPLQEEFDHRLRVLTATRAHASASSDHLDELFASLQSRAFLGHL